MKLGVIRSSPLVIGVNNAILDWKLEKFPFRLMQTILPDKESAQLWWRHIVNICVMASFITILLQKYILYFLVKCSHFKENDNRIFQTFQTSWNPLLVLKYILNSDDRNKSNFYLNTTKFALNLFDCYFVPVLAGTLLFL